MGVDLKEPKLIPFCILRLEVCESSPTGLVFRIQDNADKRKVHPTNPFSWSDSGDNLRQGLYRAFQIKGKWYRNDMNLSGSSKQGMVVVETY